MTACSTAREPDMGRVLEVAWTRACDGLGLPRDTALAANEASVLLKYAIAEIAALPESRGSNAACRARRALRTWVDGGLSVLGRALKADARDAVTRVLRSDPCYAGRLVDLAVCDLVSEPMAPEVCIDPDPWFELPDDGAGWNHGVVFAAAALVTHELYALAADACVHDAHSGGPCFRVVGVHGDWLSGAQAHRVLVLDCDRDRFREASLTTPLELDSAQLTALGKRQIERHRCWASSLPCPIVNPWPAAAAADDKHGAVSLWRDAGLEVPDGELLHPGDRVAARGCLDKWGEIVVKPNAGSEGECVLYLDAGDADALSHLDSHLSACWEWGPALVEPRRDRVAWRNRDTGQLHSLAVRLHVGCGAEGPSTESGYGQLGLDESTPATRGGGGMLLPLHTVLQSLVRRDNAAPVEFTAADLDRLRSTSDAAAGVIGGLGLSGVDLVLDVSSRGQIVPVLVEINPRPAGLSHSRFLPGCGGNRCEAGVSLAMWEGIAALATASPAG